MKIVTMCRGGQVRSVGLKYLLSYKYGHDVIPCGWESNTDETREMLFQWADYIVTTQKEMEKYIPWKLRAKLICYDVGEDTYGYAFHPQLLRTLELYIQEHGLFNEHKKLK